MDQNQGSNITYFLQIQANISWSGMVRDKQGAFQLSKKGFWKVYQFSLVELRSYVFPCYVFLEVNDIE